MSKLFPEMTLALISGLNYKVFADTATALLIKLYPFPEESCPLDNYRLGQLALEPITKLSYYIALGVSPADLIVTVLTFYPTPDMILVNPRFDIIFSLPFPWISQVPEGYPYGWKTSRILVFTADNPA